MASLVTILRRARTLLWTALSIVIIFCAVMVGLGKLLMPYSAHFQPRLEAWLSSEFGRPVEIESFTGQWRAFGPQLAVKGLKLPDANGGPGAAVIEEALIDIRPFNVLIPARALYEFRIVGADFHLVHLADGGFEFSGLGLGGGDRGSESALRQLASISEVILEDSSLRYDDEEHDVHLDVREVNGRLQVRGDEVSAAIGFRLAHGSAGTVSGELEATARLELDDGQHPRSARWKLSGQELMLGQLREQLPQHAYFPRQGRFNTEMWGEWDRVEQHRIRGVVDLRDARLVNEFLDHTLVRLNTRFKWQFTSLEQWRLDLADFLYDDGHSLWNVARLGLGRSLEDEVGLWVSADAVPMQPTGDIAREVFRIFGRDWPRYLPGRGKGVVRDFELSLNARMKLASLTGNFRVTNVSEWGKWPDISNVDGVFDFGFRHGSLNFSGRDVVVEWPRMFTSALSLDIPSCVLNFSWTGEKGENQISVDKCFAENEFLSGNTEMRFRANTGKPAVDIIAHVDRLDVGAVGDYWPRDLLKARVVEWLGTAVRGGQLESGRLQIHGDMDHWPFDEGRGRFETLVEVRDAEIAYFEGWPEAREVHGIARFVNTGMDFEARAGSIGGIEGATITAGIDDFRDAVLRLDYHSESELSGLIGFLRESPLGERFGGGLSDYEFEGPAQTAGSLTLPFGDGGEGLSLQGSLELAGNRFGAPDLEFTLAGISGSIRYAETGFEGKGLSAEYLGKPASLSIRAGAKAPEDRSPAGPDPAAGRLTARLSGKFGVSDVLPQHLRGSWSPLNRIEGSSDWEATFQASSGEAGLTLTSGLEGVAVSLPAPLDKAADARWPFTFSVPLKGDTRTLHVSVANRLSAKLVLGEGWDDPRSAAVRFGAGEAQLPGGGLLTIAGEAGSMNLDGWIGLVVEQARRGKSLAGLELESGTLSADEFVFLDRLFEDVDISFSASDGALNAVFGGKTMDGELTYMGVGGASQSLSAEFERLVLDEPLTSGMEMDVDPSLLPALHLYARSFRWSGVELGETRIEAYPTAKGFHFEKVEAESPDMSVRANGDWSLEDGTHRSSFDIHMASESLGDFLRHLDIASPVEGGQTLVDFGVWWEGSPAQFRLARLNGDVNFSVNSGVITNASPGSGRLLGLLAVQSLPRRLALDFRDVFDSGFAFDEAKGTFTMQNGSARTENVTLKSSAANISFSGTTDLVDRKYDQVITVRPGLGNTLPVIGAIAGGPGGAAAGLALQGLLHDELGEASQVQYTLTGAWDEPQIEPILKSRADG